MIYAFTMTKRIYKPPFSMRLPETIKQRIDDAAAKNGRSINSEITERLIDSFVIEMRPLSTYSDGELIRELIDRHQKGKIRIEIEK